MILITLPMPLFKPPHFIEIPNDQTAQVVGLIDSGQEIPNYLPALPLITKVDSGE